MVSLKRLVLSMGCAAALLLSSQPSQAQLSDHPSSQPLTGAAEIGFAPFMMSRPDGTIEGYSFDLATEMARRLGRPSFNLMQVPFAGIFAGLYAKRYEFIAAPVTITERRAAEMLFSEPYHDVSLAFVTRADRRLTSVDELRGKRIGVVSGSVQDEWMRDNASRYGIEPMRFESTPDSLQAVTIRRIDGHMTTLDAGLWMLRTQRQFAVDVRLPPSGRFGFAFRPEDTEFRDLFERQLECMKRDGTMARIYERWFGAPPDPASSTVTVSEGLGAPGWRGHVANAPANECR